MADNGVELQIRAQNLTKDAFDQVASQLKTLGADTKTYFNEASESAGRFSGILGETKEAIVGWAAGLVAGEAVLETFQEVYRRVVEFLGSSIEAFAEAESAERRLTVALQTQGLAIPGLNDQYTQLARSYQTTTAYSHTAIEAAEALFVQLGNVGPAQMNRALKAATDLSSGLGIDLPSAVQLLSRAAEGQTATFARYGIVLDQAKVQTEGFGYVLDAVESKVGGQAQAELDTYAGRVKQLGNEWDDVKEKVGAALVKNVGVEAAFDLISDALTRQNSILPDLKTNWAGLLELFAPDSGAFAYMTRAFVKASEDERQMETAFAAAQRIYDAEIARQKQVLDDLDKGLTAKTAIPEELKAAWAADDTALKEHAKHIADAIQQIRNAVAGADLAEKAHELEAALGGLGHIDALPADAWARAADQAAKLRDQGAQLTPELQQLALAHDAIASAAAAAAVKQKDELAAFEAWQKIAGGAIANLPIGTFRQPFVQTVAPIDVSGALAQQAHAGQAILDQTFNDIEGRMKALGVDTQTDLAGLARSTAEQYASMAKSGLYTADELEAAWNRYVAAAIAAGHGLKVQFEDDLIHIGAAALQAFASGGSIGQALEGSTVALGEHLGSNLATPLVKELAKSSPLLSHALASLAGPLGGAAAELGIDLGKQLWDHFFGTAGRDEVVNFANSQGGFDTLHQELLDKLTNGVGEQFWIKLTQEVGRNDKAGADALIAEIQKALANAAPSFADQASSAGYQTIDDLQTAANKAVQLWQYMRDSGKYTASEVQDAWSKAEAAMSAAGDGALSDLEKAKSAAQSQLDEMNSKIQSLQQSIGQEAPEEVMGVIEQQQRAQLAQLQQQAQAQQQQIDDYTQQIQDAANAAVTATQGAASQAGKDTVDAIQDALDHADFKVRVSLEGDGSLGSVPGHADGAYIREDHLAMVHAGEMIGDQTFFGQAIARALAGLSVGGGSNGQMLPIRIELDGQVLAAKLVRLIPAEVRRYGVLR